MRKRPASHRGKTLENKIEAWLKAMPNLFYVKIEVARVGKVFLKKQPFDFLVIRHDGRVVAFDAKETSEKRFYASKVPEHQKEAIAKLHHCRHCAGFAVWFREQDPDMQHIRFIEDLHRSATIEDGVDLFAVLRI